jgi:uncharacterized protein with PIN domain
MNHRQKFCFVAENTLGKLAKWLRILGFDTIYERTSSSIQSYESNRIHLTRTRHIYEKRGDKSQIFITSDHYPEQLKQVVRELGITLDDVAHFSRCIRCNRPVCGIDKKTVLGKVPDYIWETQHLFWTCDRCNRIYWSGSHIGRSKERIERIFRE